MNEVTTKARIRTFGDGTTAIKFSKSPKNKPGSKEHHNLSEQEKEARRIANRNLKRYRNTTDQLLSEPMTHFLTLTVPENHYLRNDPSELLIQAKNFLKTSNVKFCIVLEEYAVGKGFHLHGLTDGPVDIQAWTKWLGLDFSDEDLYCKQIQSNQEACANYITKNMSRLPLGFKHIASNFQKKKSTFTIVEDNEVVYQNTEAKKVQASNTGTVSVNIQAEEFNYSIPVSMSTHKYASISVRTASYQYYHIDFTDIEMPLSTPIRITRDKKIKRLFCQCYLKNIHFSKATIQLSNVYVKNTILVRNKSPPITFVLSKITKTE